MIKGSELTFCNYVVQYVLIFLVRLQIKSLNFQRLRAAISTQRKREKMIKRIMSSKWANEKEHPVTGTLIPMILTVVIAAPIILIGFWFMDHNPWYTL